MSPGASATYYVVATFDSVSGTVLYVDGVFDADGVAEVAVYDHVLTLDRIEAHCRAGK